MNPRHTILAVLLTVTACGTSGNTTEPATPPAAAAPTPANTGGIEPQTEAAVQAAATDEFDSYASGDYGATWDLFYAPAKKLITRAEYMHLFDLCPDIAAGSRFTIEKVTLDNDHEAHVRVSRLGIAVLSYRFVYELGHWRFVPDAESMRDYRTKTVQQMAAGWRAQGGCAKS